MISRDEVVQLEEMNFNAWPALKTLHYDGWLLRCTGGASRRPNSVNCLHPSKIALEEKIAFAEMQYDRWRRDAIFRLTPLADEGLDARLEQRGYQIQEPTFVQLADVKPCRIAPEVRVETRPSDEWIAAALRIRGLSGTEAEVFEAQQRAIAPASAWALVVMNELPVAVGVAAIESGWAGLHGIYVAKEARRHGVARVLSEGLLGFSYSRGAQRAWLQVAQSNFAALPLYRSLGFHTAYSYHHRRRAI